MASVNRNDVEDALEGFSNTESGQPIPYNAHNATQVEQKEDISTRDILLRKLEEELSHPLHRRLLNVYISTATNSAKESMEYELKRILLEVLDRED